MTLIDAQEYVGRSSHTQKRYCDTLASHPLYIYRLCVCVAYNTTTNTNTFWSWCVSFFFFYFFSSSYIYSIIRNIHYHHGFFYYNKKGFWNCGCIHSSSFFQVPSELLKSSTALFSAYSSSGGDNKSVTLPDLPYDYNALECTFVFVFVLSCCVVFLCCFLSCVFC